MSVQVVEAAIGALSSGGLFEVEISGFYQTPAFPAGAGPDFVNGALRATTDLSASEVLALLHDVEDKGGRTRTERWEARALDLDLIDFDGQIAPSLEVFETWRDLPLAEQMERAPDQMILPHPRVQDRPFVLVPLRDVAPDWVHPVSGVSIDAMLERFDAEALKEIRLLKP